MDKRMTTQDIKAWVALSRPPFHSVGVLPYILGAVVAWRMAHVFQWSVFFIGAAGVIFIMLATYYAGEYWDFREDSLSKGSRFAGGSKVLQKHLLSRRTVLLASIISVGCALVVGIILQFLLQTGPWTIPFGLLGILGGFFYSTRPIRWVSTGFGEVWIAFCYGWLPVAVGYYLHTGTLDPYIHIISVPIALTIFNVILLNEYPDRESDRSALKMNILARIGPQAGVYLYTGIAVLSWVAFGFSLYQGIDQRTGIVYIPILFVSLVVVWNMLKKRWEDDRMLERLCGITILINLATTAVYLVAFLWLEVD